MKKLLFFLPLLLAATQIISNEGMNFHDAKAILKRFGKDSGRKDSPSDVIDSLKFLTRTKACAENINAADSSGKKYCLSIAHSLETFIMYSEIIGQRKGSLVQKNAQINRVAESHAQIMKNYSSYTK